MMGRKKVYYAFEDGDPSLPHVKDLISETPDSDKAVILDYLTTNFIIGCPGIIHDVITPGKTIGSGSLYADDLYFWNDALIGYFERYNLKLPEAFRQHILSKYKARKDLHLRHRLLRKIRFENNPCHGKNYETEIDKHGTVMYRNTIDCKDSVILELRRDDADWIVHELTTQIYCYDEGDHGKPNTDGHHWRIDFFNAKGLCDTREGWQGEADCRYRRIARLAKTIEHYIGHDLGSNEME